MKRIGYLYENIWDWDNLLSAYAKARKGKHGASVEEYAYEWERMLLQTQSDLKLDNFRFSNYHHFNIYEPKQREITAAPFCDRVVHHAICNIIGPILDKPQIVDNYACRSGKGLHRAIKRAFYFYKHSQYHYRLDISKFYYTIDHEILMRLIMRKIKDKKLLDLLRSLLATHESGREYYQDFAGDDLFDMIRARGLPIGNLSSQLFANYYLSGLDHYIRETLHFSRYVRYMDDIIIFSEDKNSLTKAREAIIHELSKLRLKPNPRKDIIQSNSQGIDFLGFRLIGNTIRVRTQNLNRFRKKLSFMSKSKPLHVRDVLKSYNGHLGYLLAGHTKKVVDSILESITFHDEQKAWKLTV